MSKRRLSFKWFGSLSNLSFRRWSKSQTKQHGSMCAPVLEEKCVDDMDMCSRSPGYARSSDMYTHMGTMPRLSFKKKGKSGKGSTKSTDRNESPQQVDDYVCDSPLLSALSGQAGLTINQLLSDTDGKSISTSPPSSPSPPDKAMADSTGSPSHSAPMPTLPQKRRLPEQQEWHSCPPEPSPGPEVTSADPVGSAVVTPPSDSDRSPPLGTKLSPPSIGQQSEGSSTQESAFRRQELDTGQHVVSEHSSVVVMDSRDDYVQFSKEKYLLDSSPEKLRKELEEELKLSSSDLRSHGWYHGPVPREVSESLVLRNGDFLIRDSLANPGDYVLTSRWEQEVLHLRINKVLVKCSESRVQYLLERETFDTLPALVRFYVSGRRPVCAQRGAHIYCPISRTFPLRYLEASYALANSRQGPTHSPSNPRGASIKRRSITMTDGLTTGKLIPHRKCSGTGSSNMELSVPEEGVEMHLSISPSTVRHKEAMRNCALSMDQIQEFRSPLSPVGEVPMSPAYSSITRHRSPPGSKVLNIVPPSPGVRRSSEPQLSPSHNAPPHPDPPHDSYCELHPSPAPSPAPPTKSYVERLSVEESWARQVGREDSGETFVTPLMETSSCFCPSRYTSALLPAENKPLEMSVLKRVKEVLAEVDAKTAAKHITKEDCRVARIQGITKEMQKTMGVGSGLELLTLPHGHQLRVDLLERFYTMSIMVAVDLLGCTGSTEERASLLHKTVQLAAELKSCLGNMFGFAAVMRALELPQITRLEQTWMTLRQRHTEGAILYEKKLKPFMKGLNDGKESCVLSSTCFPHIIPLLTLLERGVVPGEGAEPWESMEAGVDVVMLHLEEARSIAHHGAVYCSNAESKLQGFEEQEEVLEMFHTEFQMRLLWGSRGAEGGQAERYEKFDKVLTALSNKLEPPVRQSEL